MSQYLLNIDSTYRDRKLYRFSTEFGVTVNPTPGQNASGNIFVVDNIIYSRFQWNGNTTTIIANDTIEGVFIDFATTTVILDTAHLVNKLNYYLGCQFVIDSGQSSVITFYDNESNTIRLENPIFPPPSTNAYKIINPSYIYPNEMLLLGSNLYVTLFNENLLNSYFLKSGPTNSLFIQNVTKNWILPIYKVIEKFKVVTFENDLPSYSNGDVFQIREDGNVLMYMTQTASVSSSIQEYGVTTPGSGYSVGQTVVIVPGLASYTITGVDRNGGIVSLFVISPGSDYTPGLYQADNGGNTSATFAVYSIEYSITVNGSPYPDGQYLLSVSSISPLSASFFPVKQIQNNVIFFNNPDGLIIMADVSVELLIYRSHSSGLNMPLVSYTQAVCYEVSLIHLIIPNQPVYGYNVLPTFFPYIMVELYNVSSSTSNAGILYSNNPNTERVAFYCPIGNPKNPLIVSYLIIPSATQVQLIKWNPLDNFFFRILLPNGETLKYNFDLDIDETDLINGDIATLATSEFHFWGQMTDRRISATFSFRLR